MEQATDLDILLCMAVERLRLLNAFLDSYRKPNDRTGMYFIGGEEHNLNVLYENTAGLLTAIDLEIFDRNINEASIA